MRDGAVEPFFGVCTEEEYFADLLEAPGGRTDRELAMRVVRGSEECLRWMEEGGARFQPPLSGILSLARTSAFFLGGGKALVNARHRTAGRPGAEARCDSEAVHVEVEGGKVG